MTQHIFEEAGLGKAPFSFVGCFSGNATYSENSPQVTVCAYCSTLIVNCFQIQSADNKTFIVGCECVKKTGDKGLVDMVKREQSRQRAEKRRIKELEKWEAERPMREAKQAAQKAEEQAKQSQTKSDYELVKPILSAKPHPTPFFAKKGLTMLDYLNYFLKPDTTEPCWSDWKVIKTISEAKGNI